MSKFEQRGVERQLEAVTVKEAKRAFSISCQICTNTGRCIDCSKCAIAHNHQFVLECFAI